MSELLIGCGNSRKKNLWLEGESREWQDMTSLDASPRCNPDVVWNLNVFPYPFKDNHFDEIHAYEVLEHCGRQGDAAYFFRQFYEFWRILVPNGRLYATVPMPSSPWAWGDPGHTRVIPKESLVYLSQAQYRKQVGHTCMTDFRDIYKADFEPLVINETDGLILAFILQAKKGQQ